jgi:hypothetical protein
VEFIRHEKRTDPAPWVDEATVQRVAGAAEIVGGDRLKPIFDALGGSVSYEEIRIAMECRRNAAVGNVSKRAQPGGNEAEEAVAAGGKEQEER